MEEKQRLSVKPAVEQIHNHVGLIEIDKKCLFVKVIHVKLALNKDHHGPAVVHIKLLH